MSLQTLINKSPMQQFAVLVNRGMTVGADGSVVEANVNVISGISGSLSYLSGNQLRQMSEMLQNATHSFITVYPFSSPYPLNGNLLVINSKKYKILDWQQPTSGFNLYSEFFLEEIKQ